MVALQQVEYLLGSLACSALGVLTPFLPSACDNPPQTAQRILVMKFWGIGSLVLATPFLHALRARFPHASIHLVTLQRNHGIVKMLPHLDEVLLVNLGSTVPTAIWRFLRCLREVHRRRFDLVFDLEFYTQASAVATLATWAPLRVGYQASGIWRGNVHNRKIAFNVYRSVPANFLALLEAVGCPLPEIGVAPHLSVPEEAMTEAAELMERLEIAGRPFVIVNVNAGELALERRWPIERYVDLCATLAERYAVRLLFTGTDSERPYVEGAVQALRERGYAAHNLAGALSLSGFAALSRRAAFVITNDSGPMHVAAAVGGRVVALFGPETPVLYGPVGDGHVVLYAGLPCSPCINIERGKRGKCHYPVLHCQLAIEVAAVLEGIDKHYGGVLRAPP